MVFKKEQYHRRSIRLPNYDYSKDGWYFVTICVKDRECLFGDIVAGTGLNDVGTGFKPVPTTTIAPLSEIIRGLKTFSARQINEIRQTPGKSIWQRSFHDHIIRNEKSYWHIKTYIQNNPLNWLTDRNNPVNLMV